jgi:hypothetical protein
MSYKKTVILLVLLLFVSSFGFSQIASVGMDIGIVASYNPFDPSFWSVGIMSSFGSGNHWARVGMTVGQITLTYEKENPFTSRHEMTEYWQRGLYMDFIFGYAYQIDLIDILALRIGADYFTAFSYAYIHSDFNKDMPFNLGLTGIGGLVLFPKGKISVSLDVCPGFTLNPFKAGNETFAFIMPIRLVVSWRRVVPVNQ